MVITRPVLIYHTGYYETGAKIAQGDYETAAKIPHG